MARMMKLVYSRSRIGTFIKGVITGVLLTLLFIYQHQPSHKGTSDQPSHKGIFDQFFHMGTFDHFFHDGISDEPSHKVPLYCKADVDYIWEGQINKTEILLRETYVFDTMYSNHVIQGGRYDPSLQHDCSPIQNVAIIVPYRNRSQDLQFFIPYIHNFLQRQRIKYTIYLIEQSQNKVWNKGRLLNVGFVEATKDDDFDCFIFHDIDTLPVDDRNSYTCGPKMTYPISGIDFFNFAIDDGTGTYNITGGVTLFTPSAFQTVNGFSNNFWGWGCEDDEMSHRINLSGLTFFRRNYTPSAIGFYITTNGESHGLPNFGNTQWSENVLLLNNVKETFRHDGLNTLNYSVVEHTAKPFYTNIVVDV